MNKIKYLFFLVLCFGIIGGVTKVSAQNGDRTLVTAGKQSLKQSDIDTLIKFYEWAFEAKFTATEREKFQAFTAAEFRANPVESRKTIEDIVTTLPRILAVSADIQAETRKNFLAVFLPDARKNSDENSQMLLDIYETAQGGDRQTSPTDDSSDGKTISNDDSAVASASSTSSRNANLGGLNGKWSRGTGSGFVDYTGKTRYKSGQTYNFEFFADGTVEYVSETDVLSIVQCRIKGADKARGKYNVSGDSLTISLGAMSSVGTNSCDAKGNYNKTLPASSVTVKFKIKKMDSITRPDNPTMLCFDGKDGETCFERANK